MVDAATHGPMGNGETAAGPRERRGVWEWLTRRHALANARRAAFERSPEKRVLTERARETALVADRLFDAVEPVSTATGHALAAELYRQSVLWSLAARAPEELEEAAPDELWEATGARDLLALPPEPGEHRRVEQAITAGDFRSLALLPEGDRQRLAGQLRTLAASALELGSPGDGAVRRLLLQRFVRVLAFLLLLSGFTALAVVAGAYIGQKPNLAAGKPWKTSSTFAECTPETKSCGSLHARIFFHTREDNQPWIEFDLVTPTQFSEVYVRNRTDSVPDRAVPLVVEVSDDAQVWRPVARRDDTFTSWTASFAPVTARYVRLRVDRRSYLHLEIVEIHA